MSENLVLQLNAIVLLRQRIDQRIDAEIFRMTNGLEEKKNTVNELIELVKESAYAEMVKKNEG